MQVKELQELLKLNYRDSYNIYRLLTNKDIIILDHEKRKIIDTTQTVSLDSDYISHIEEFITYEYYIEYAKDKKNDYIAFKFDDIEPLYILDQLIKDKSIRKRC